MKFKPPSHDLLVNPKESNLYLLKYIKSYL